MPHALRRLHRSIASCTSAAAIVCSIGAATAQSPPGAFRISLSYETEVDRVKPTPRQGITIRRDVIIDVASNKSIRETWVSRSARIREEKNASLQLGGGAPSGQWRVLGANKLVRFITWPTSVTKIEVTVNGSDCQASVVYGLLAGAKEYVFEQLNSKTVAYFSRATANWATCRIDPV